MPPLGDLVQEHGGHHGVGEADDCAGREGAGAGGSGGQEGEGGVRQAMTRRKKSISSLKKVQMPDIWIG